METRTNERVCPFKDRLCSVSCAWHDKENETCTIHLIAKHLDALVDQVKILAAVQR
jgi:hypothetical protein